MLTRRAILRNASLAIVAASVVDSHNAHAAPTISKALADYQDHPHDSQRCTACCMFVPGYPNRCTMIKGVISPNGWCKYWKAGPNDTCS